jgi:polysaccharide export outer membrane protein
MIDRPRALAMNNVSILWQTQMKLRMPLFLSGMILLGACSTLPSSGPTGPQVRRAARADTQLGLSIVAVNNAAALPPVRTAPVSALVDLPPPPSDMVGPGDVLGVSIYEAGVSLFGNAPAASSGGGAAGAFDAGARVQSLPELRVDDQGNITIPYAGTLHVAGQTVGEIQAAIRNALLGLSQNPQVLVTRREVISNAVIVGGEVVRPGRLVLQTNQETLADVVALSGGYKGKASDLVLRVRRGGETADLRLNSILSDSGSDVRAYPGDRLTLVSDPLSFSVLGAAGRREQVPFTTATMTLAQAIAAAGGPNPDAGDPAAVFVFRYVEERGDGGEIKRKPVVYHIDLMKTGGYFLAQSFLMQNRDILYFGNARANQPSKLVQLVSQLFSPILTVTSAVSVIENSN